MRLGIVKGGGIIHGAMEYAYWAGSCTAPSCRVTIIVAEIGPVQKGWEQATIRPKWAEGDCPRCQKHHKFAGSDLWVSIYPGKLDIPADRQSP